MAETVEYALVVMASAFFVAGSVATYSSFSSFESGVQFRAEFQAISTLASTAVVNGSSTETLSLPASTISCESETLYLQSGSLNRNASLGVPCDFHISVPQGVSTLTFSISSSRLVALVD
jgi:hypothetical protein